MKPVFTKGQIKLLLHPNQKRVVWSVEDISSAIALRSVTPKGYRYLRKKGVPLPSLSTLRKWAAKIQVHPGVLTDVVKMMKTKGKDQPVHQKLCILSFDEIYISQHIEIERKEERPIGPHKTVQVGMARALFSNWKQVIYFEYDKALTPETVKNIVGQLYDAGYTVVGVTADQGSTNTTIWKKMGVGIGEGENCYFTHPCNDELKVFVFADPPHLLKCIRNNLLDSGFLINNNFVDKRWLEKLLLFNNRELKIAYKLERKHLDVTGSERQNVAYAAAVLSNNTAEAIRWCGINKFFCEPYYRNWNKCADILKLCNDWFDVLNSKTKFGKINQKNAYGVNIEDQDKILNDMTNLMKNMRVGSHQSLLPFQKGVILTNTSLMELYKYLKNNYRTEAFNFSYILTKRLNQDVLENFFSYIRGMGAAHSKPSALQFRYRLRWYILGKHSNDMFTENCNTEDDDDETLVNASEIPKGTNSEIGKKNENSNLEQIIGSANETSIRDILGDVYDEEMILFMETFVENEDEDPGKL